MIKTIIITIIITRYKLKVVAHNQRGEANIAAQEVIGYSGESEPSEAPKLFTLREVNINNNNNNK